MAFEPSISFSFTVSSATIVQLVKIQWGEREGGGRREWNQQALFYILEWN